MGGLPRPGEVGAARRHRRNVLVPEVQLNHRRPGGHERSRERKLVGRTREADPQNAFRIRAELVDADPPPEKPVEPPNKPSHHSVPADEDDAGDDEQRPEPLTGGKPFVKYRSRSGHLDSEDGQAGGHGERHAQGNEAQQPGKG